MNYKIKDEFLPSNLISIKDKLKISNYILGNELEKNINGDNHDSKIASYGILIEININSDFSKQILLGNYLSTDKNIIALRHRTSLSTNWGKWIFIKGNV